MKPEEQTKQTAEDIVSRAQALLDVDADTLVEGRESFEHLKRVALLAPALLSALKMARLQRDSLAAAPRVATPEAVDAALLARLRELDAKATKGPWFHVSELTPEETGSPGGSFADVIVETEPADDDGPAETMSVIEDIVSDDDFALIAEMRTALPTLLALATSQPNAGLPAEVVDAIEPVLDLFPQSEWEAVDVLRHVFAKYVTPKEQNQ